MKKKKTKWTHFMDMHSGGGQKEKWAHIYIEAPENEARVIFYNKFGHNPDRVTCTCCGNDYSVIESDNVFLEQFSYKRWCHNCGVLIELKDGVTRGEDEDSYSFACKKCSEEIENKKDGSERT